MIVVVSGDSILERSNTDNFLLQGTKHQEQCDSEDTYF